jgi:serine phosphatase RsbU (regulator of sigma subunit)
LRIKNKQLQQAYEELKAAQAQLLAKERMQTELATARKIQEGLLPRQMPQIAGWELAALWQPAREVSGDFYDFMSFPDGRLLIIIGDVTGKGVPAALVMATTRSVLRAAAQSAQQTGRLSPGSLLTHVNELLIPDMPPMMFVTCLVALLDPVSGKLAFANAGHCLPFQCNRRSTVELLATGMPLGLMPGMLYDEQGSVIEPGDRLFMFSDGLVEAHNPKGEMFGKDRILQKLNSSASDKNGKGEMLIASLQDALKQFSGAEWEQEDDVTFVVLTRA